MKYHKVLPQSAEWFMLRSGKVTASEFHRLVTLKTWQPSKQKDAYLNELLAEWALRTAFTRPEVKVLAMDRGVELEEEAVAYYEHVREEVTEVAGFFETDDGWLGASPDRLVGDEGLLEIKCPLADTQVGYFLQWRKNGALPEAYYWQRQVQLFVSERKWLDFLSYYPGLPPVLARVEPDPKAFATIREVMGEAIRYLQSHRRLLGEEMGEAA